MAAARKVQETGGPSLICSIDMIVHCTYILFTKYTNIMVDDNRNNWIDNRQWNIA